MIELLGKALPWVMSGISMIMPIMTGNKNRWSWAVGLGNQALWLTWIIITANWGFLPLCLWLVVVYARNHVKWQREATS